MEFKVKVVDTVSQETSESVVTVRKGTSHKTVALKGVEDHVNKFAADPLDFMSEVKYLHREAFDTEDFIGWLKQDLDLEVKVIDVNNLEE